MIAASSPSHQPSPQKFVLAPAKGKKNCHLGPAPPISLTLLIAAFAAYIDATENEQLFQMGKYLTLERQCAAHIPTLLHLRVLLMCLIKSAHVLRILPSQLRKALIHVYNDERFKDKQEHMKTCKYPVSTWVRCIVGAIIIALTHVRNLGLKSYRY